MFHFRPQVKSEPVKREVQPKMSDSRLQVRILASTFIICVIESILFQACGWSLPNTPGTPKEGSRTVPVPVFCAPLFNDDSDAKVTARFSCVIYFTHVQYQRLY